MRARLILQVHDELIVECPAEMADAVADQLELEKCQVLDVTFQDEISKEGIYYADGFFSFGNLIAEENGHSIF